MIRACKRTGANHPHRSLRNGLTPLASTIDCRRASSAFARSCGKARSVRGCSLKQDLPRPNRPVAASVLHLRSAGPMRRGAGRYCCRGRARVRPGALPAVPQARLPADPRGWPPPASRTGRRPRQVARDLLTKRGRSRAAAGAILAHRINHVQRAVSRPAAPIHIALIASGVEYVLCRLLSVWLEVHGAYTGH
jgi:hypothetical protein